MSTSVLSLNQVSVSVSEKEIIHSLDLHLKAGQIHCLMGPNGSGKSSLSLALMGHPDYTITSGDITLDGESLLQLSPDERAHRGLFLAFQAPLALPGLSVQNTLKSAYEAIHCSNCNLHQHCPKLSVTEFRAQLCQNAARLGLSPSHLSRDFNDGFSGGEKKRLEMLTLLTLKPKVVLLDEIDSGLDVDSIKLVAQTISEVARQDHVAVLLITHYRRLLEFLKPNQVSVLLQGHLVKSAGPELIDQIEDQGYASFR